MSQTYSGSTEWGIGHLFQRHWRVYLSIVIFGFIGAALDMVNVALMVPLLNSLSGQAGGVDVWLGHSTWLSGPEATKRICLILLGVILVKTAVSILTEYLMSRAGSEVLRETRAALLKKYASLPYASILEIKHGDLMYRALSAPFKISELFRKAPLIVVEALKVAGIVSFLLWFNPRISILVLGAGAVFYGLIRTISSKVSTNIGFGRSRAFTDLSATFSEFLTGLKQIRIYGGERRWFSAYESANRSYSRFYVHDNMLLSLPKSILEMFGLGLLLVTILLMQLTGSGGGLATIGVFGFAILKLLPAASTIGRTWLEIASAAPEADIVRADLQRPDEGPTFGSVPFEGLDGEVRFEQVVFQYKDRAPVLAGLDFVVPKNRILAIVGKSGSGKTTIANLLLGLHQVSSGRILVNGRDLRDFDIRSWLSRVGFVSQDTFIFHGTVEENISFGNDSLTHEDVVAAAKLANAHEFISQMPDGYGTVVGEKGMKLSGGQQQRLAIARAVARRPDLLIFDEATSALDNVSERAIQAALERISQNHTVIVIAHRLSTVQSADRIAFLEKGRFVEEGKHEDLLRKGGAYSLLFNSLSRETDESVPFS